jgi:hypothetical protein
MAEQNQQNINLTLTLEQTNAVLTALSKFPYDQVAELIANVSDQARGQVQQPQDTLVQTPELVQE